MIAQDNQNRAVVRMIDTSSNADVQEVLEKTPNMVAFDPMELATIAAGIEEIKSWKPDMICDSCGCLFDTMQHGEETCPRCERSTVSRYHHQPAMVADNMVLVPAELVSLSRDILHQLSTDSDLDNKVSAPEKYETIVERLRKILETIDGDL
jgi:uncharacterized Zn finger protein (UPF0148 family)